MGRSCFNRIGTFINALLLEIHDDGRVDLDSLYANEALSFPPHMRAGTSLKLLREHFAWAVRYRPESARDRPYFWYASEENMEPRRGRRGVDDGELYELPVNIVGRIEELLAALVQFPAEESVGRFVARHPDLRYMAGWVYTLAQCEYAVARMDLLGKDFSPLKIMRFQIATYGMLKYRPRSKNWIRATLLQGAGLPEELAAGHHGGGLLPTFPDAG